MKNKSKERILSLTEGAICVALAFVLELLFVWLNAILGISALLPFGGTVTVSVLPIIYYSYRRGTAWGVFTGLIYASLQMALGFYVPPAKTVWALMLCVLLDYILAFTVMGCANIFAKPWKGRRLVGYAVGAVSVCVIRFASSFLSGVILWGAYAPEGMNVWLYSLIYNASYMIPNAILTGIAAFVICAAIDPRTLKRMNK